ncbi:MAG: PriCT-2 domain-containing protein, partial [Eubacterium sp.]
MKTELTEILRFIDPAALNYNDWLNVGMALHQEGYAPGIWDAWSAQDSKRYHPGECDKKWNGFNGNGNPITGGTIVQLAMDQGWSPSTTGGQEFGWDDEIGGMDDLRVIDSNWVEGQEVREPEQWNPVVELVTYLETLFESTENVGYVTECWEKDGKYMPKKGAWDRTAGELIQALQQCDDDIGAVFGDYKSEVGAWIRFNPLDGQGVKNDNVVDFRYALVESDIIEIDKQNAIIRELELPVACLV